MKKVSDDWIDSELIRLSQKDAVIKCDRFMFRLTAEAIIEDSFRVSNEAAPNPPGYFYVKKKIIDLVNKEKMGTDGAITHLQLLNNDKFNKKIQDATIEDVYNIAAPNYPLMDYKQSFVNAVFNAQSSLYWTIKYTLKTIKLTCVSLSVIDGTAILFYINQFNEINSMKVIKKQITDVELFVPTKKIGNKVIS